MDKIILTGIEVYAHGGVSEAERQIGQRYRVHVELRRDVAGAAGSDALDDTVSYAEVHRAVVETLRERPFNLLESATSGIVTRLLADFDVQSVTVRLEKLLPPIDGVVATAAVEITRDRSEHLEPC